jgi:hypothetical protein
MPQFAKVRPVFADYEFRPAEERPASATTGNQQPTTPYQRPSRKPSGSRGHSVHTDWIWAVPKWSRKVRDDLAAGSVLGRPLKLHALQMSSPAPCPGGRVPQVRLPLAYLGTAPMMKSLGLEPREIRATRPNFKYVGIFFFGTNGLSPKLPAALYRHLTAAGRPRPQGTRYHLRGNQRIRRVSSTCP